MVNLLNTVGLGVGWGAVRCGGVGGGWGRVESFFCDLTSSFLGVDLGDDNVVSQCDKIGHPFWFLLD